MKNLALFLFIVLTAGAVAAQTPQAISYQAVARNSAGHITPLQNIGVRFSITDASGSAILYQETHSTKTNIFGLFTLAIGKGTATNGTFPAIDWGTGDKFLKVEIAPRGGTNYTIQGITQLLSVPYALYAEKTNLIAGTGISIEGNIISALGGGNNFWVADDNGIHNSNTGHVGIGGLSSNTHALTVSMMENTIDGRAIAKFISNDTWQTNLRIDNTTADKAYSMVVGGPDNAFTNYGVGLGNFGVVNSSISTGFSTIPFIITSDDKVGISSSLGGSDNLPKSRLHVRDGDIYIDQIGTGVIMKSPNGQCWRMTVSDTGTPVFTAISCP